MSSRDPACDEVVTLIHSAARRAWIAAGEFDVDAHQGAPPHGIVYGVPNTPRNRARNARSRSVRG